MFFPSISKYELLTQTWYKAYNINSRNNNAAILTWTHYLILGS